MSDKARRLHHDEFSDCPSPREWSTFAVAVERRARQ
jgi:hypothetical protein